MNILFVFLMIFALFQIQPVAAANQNETLQPHPCVRGEPVCAVHWGPKADEWLSLALSNIKDARKNLHKDFRGYSCEFDVNTRGQISRIKTLTPYKAERRSPEAFVAAIKLPGQVPTKTPSSFERHLQLVLSQFPNATLQFAD